MNPWPKNGKTTGLNANDYDTRLNTPGADGIASLGSSYGGSGFRPRRLQLTLRLEF